MPQSSFLHENIETKSVSKKEQKTIIQWLPPNFHETNYSTVLLQNHSSHQ